MRLLTSSKLALAMLCAFPWNSGIEWPEHEPPTKESRFGTGVHLVGELAAGAQPIDLGEIAANHDIKGADEKRFRACSAHVVDLLKEEEPREGERRRAEVGIAYDISSGAARYLKMLGPRDYSDLRVGEIGGTIDLLSSFGGSATEPGSGRICVRDWKTGVNARKTPVGETMQIRFLALAVARLEGLDEIDVELAHIDEDGIWIDRATFDAFDLDVIHGELLALIAGIENRPAPRYGAHCSEKHCPLVASCPATANALAAIAKGARIEHDVSEPISSVDRAVAARVFLPMIRAACDAIEASLEAFATKQGPIPAGEGKLWGPVQHDGKERIDLDVAGATDTIKRHLGDEGAAVAIEVSASQASIDRGVLRVLAARGTRKRGDIKKLTDPLLAELRTIRSMKRGAPYVRFEEFKRAEDRPALPADESQAAE